MVTSLPKGVSADCHVRNVRGGDTVIVARHLPPRQFGEAAAPLPKSRKGVPLFGDTLL
ncbi:MAG: hypothetical protein AAB502_11750 [Chloroflexota bacterium]